MIEEFTLTIQDFTPQELTPNAWREFGKESLHGVYWVCGVCRKFELETDDEGGLIRKASDDLADFVSLVYMAFEPGGRLYDVEPVNQMMTGDFDDSYSITHYMPFVEPAHPFSGI